MYDIVAVAILNNSIDIHRSHIQEFSYYIFGLTSGKALKTCILYVSDFFHHLLENTHCVFVECKFNEILCSEVEVRQGVSHWDDVYDFLYEMCGI